MREREGPALKPGQSGVGMTTCISLVIPAKAGIHGWASSGPSRKEGGGGAMDPRFRGDDERGADIAAKLEPFTLNIA